MSILTLILASLVTIMILLLLYGADKLDTKRNKERNDKCDAIRKLYSVGQVIVLKEDYYGQDLVFRKGRIGTIISLPDDYFIAIVSFDRLEVCINLIALGRIV